VDLGGIDGLVHKSELSWNKVNNPEAGYRVGEDVEAEVIDINHERGRISLSIRRLQPDPWESTVADFNVGDVIDGTVTKIVNFGAFVRVRDGLEGLIHISELSHQRVAHPGDVVHEGQRLQLKIISLDSERHRLGLSLKQAEEAPPAREAATRERRPRQERAYDPTQAVQEPEGGIDNTLAAAFAQVRQQVEASEAARDDGTGAEPADAMAETASEPIEASTEPSAEPVSDQVVAETLRAAPDLETAAVAETADAPALEVAPAGSTESAEPEEAQASADEAPETRREAGKRSGKARAAASAADQAEAESDRANEGPADEAPADEARAEGTTSDATATDEVTPEAGAATAEADAETTPETTPEAAGDARAEGDAPAEGAPDAPTADEAARSEPTADQTTTAESPTAAFEGTESRAQGTDDAGLEAGRQERTSPDA
jgi:predicted RNA-binding protein with RPS1 domain